MGVVCHSNRTGGGAVGRVWMAIAVCGILHLICYRATTPLRRNVDLSTRVASAVKPFGFERTAPTSSHILVKRGTATAEVSLVTYSSHSNHHHSKSHHDDNDSGENGEPPRDEGADSDAWIDWTHIYENATSTQQPFVFCGMILWLVFLFAFVGITASDFFCPNLSTIASRLGLSESVAGVTLLAFSNGSPDVFSTFAALSRGSGSLAIGELIGAASFIVSVVAGTMCLIKPFRVSRHTFLRDVGFFSIAITLTLLILYDSHIHLWEAIAMVGLYIVYVIIVAVGSWWMARKEKKEALLRAARAEYADEPVTGLDVDQDPNTLTPDSTRRSTPSLTPQGTPFSGLQPFPSLSSPTPHSAPHPHRHQVLDDDALIAAIERGVPVTLTRQRSNTHTSIASPDLGTASTSGFSPGHTRRPSLARRPMTRSTVRPSLLGAIEFRDVVNSLRADSSARTLAVFGGAGDEVHSHASFVGAESEFLARTRLRSASHSGAIRLGDDVPERQLSARPGLQDRRGTWTNARSRSESGEATGSEGPSAHWSDVEDGNEEDEEAEPIIDLSAGIENPWQGATSPGLGRRGSSGSLRMDPSGALRINVPSTSATSRMKSMPQSGSRHNSGGSIEADDDSNSNKRVRKVPSILLTSVNGSMALVQPAAEVAAPKRWATIIAEKRSFRIAYAVALALFPSLQNFGEKSIIGKATAILCVPAILLLNLTLPVVDSDTEDCVSIEEKEARKPRHDGDFVTTPMLYTDSDNRFFFNDAEEVDGENGFDSLQSRHAREAVARKLHERVLPNLDDTNSAMWNATSAATTPAAIDFNAVDRGFNSFTMGGNEVPSIQLTPNVDPLTTAPPGNEATTPPSTPLLSKKPINNDDLSRWLTAIQCTLGPVFIVCAIMTDSVRWFEIAIALGVGLVLATTCFITFTSTAHRGRIILCFVGFVVAAVWILLIVNEVVGVLLTIGHILGLSDAILGLTIFAMGNSLGDLVANATVARMGFPSMAIAACFGGPMLNILLGIGLSGCYLIARHNGEALNVQMSRTLLVSGCGLWAILMTTLIVVPLNGYWMDKRLGAGLIAAYSIVLTINVLVEIFW
ncbi:BQ5605_C001g00558 [Microbotryum silenes-dioicae]|uniref:BQ5605_C001g00558 protein n=1 Tax=Microbotryum silenes-dioicae TaxID=796604 RepID=A0A2X0M7R4_9BASI|nr:BQ5605_C001g00558 [Microbotryum silenes-dioicae]